MKIVQQNLLPFFTFAVISKANKTDVHDSIFIQFKKYAIQFTSYPIFSSRFQFNFHLLALFTALLTSSSINLVCSLQDGSALGYYYSLVKVSFKFVWQV